MPADNHAMEYLRTDDIPEEDIIAYYVPSPIDEEIITKISQSTPTLLVGSRGTGKTILLRIAEYHLQNSISDHGILPLFVKFSSSKFVDPEFFRPWMLAKILFQLHRKLGKMGFINPGAALLRRYTGLDYDDDTLGTKVECLIKILEESWKSGNGFRPNPDNINRIFGVDISTIDILNETDYFNALIEDICSVCGIRRIHVFFDEAAHNFVPLQQREFFMLFRDLRSSYFSGTAAVYPGLTSYGHTFQLFHDATEVKVQRSPESDDYINIMEEIIRKRVSEGAWDMLKKNSEALHALINASDGNPRLLLKSIMSASNNLSNFKTNTINETIRAFYRADVWNEHTRLSNIYEGHKPLIEWGRGFIEESVLPETKRKNDARSQQDNSERTIYFVVHKDAPEAIKSSVRILEYSGICRLIDEGVKMTRSELGTRYAVNFGCVLAQEVAPISKATELRRSLNIKRFTEYGFNHPAFESLDKGISLESDPNLSIALERFLSKSIDELDITLFQKTKLKDDLAMSTIGDILRSGEEDLQRAQNIGAKRARSIYNSAFNAALEYVSG